MRGAASFVFRCARCSGTPEWVRGGRSSHRCPYRVAVPPVGGGAPPALGGRRAAPVAPQLGWVRGGGGGGRHPACSRACVGGGGGGVGGASGPLAMPPVGHKRGGGAAWRSRPRGPAIGQGGRALPPPPSTESRILTQSLPGAPHPPAAAARRWPAGGGREGQGSVVSGLRGRFPWVGNKAGAPWCRAVHGGRGHPYHSGSLPSGFSGHDLRGVPVRRRGPTCSSRPPFEPAAGAWGRVTLRLPSRAGGVRPFFLGGWAPGPPWLAGRRGGGGGGPPGWGPLAAVVCGVRRWCVGGVVAGVWCGWYLATPGGGSCVLLPATPGWISLPVVVRGPRHSWLRVPAAVPRHCWLGSAGGGGMWCAAGVCWWGCGWCVVWLVPRHSWRRFLCATLRHSWLGFAACGGGRSSPLLAEGPGRGFPPLLAGFPCRRWCVVCGVWCVVCGGGVFVGFWLVCGVVGPSPLLAEVPVCYSPPLLAGFRCRWWCAVLATPG